MDHKEFDELVARIAKLGTRREAVKGLIGGALASVGIGAAAADDAEAKGKNNKGRAKGQGKGKAKSQGKGKGKAKAAGKRGGRVGAEAKGKNGKCRKDNQCLSRKCDYKKGDKRPGGCLPSRTGGQCRAHADCQPDHVCVPVDERTIGTCTPTS